MHDEAITTNSPWHITTWLIAVLVALNLLDFGTTYYLMEYRGIEEGNPIIVYFIELLGTNWAILWFKVLVFGFLFSLYGFIKDFRAKCQTPVFVKTFGMVTIAYTIIVVSNFSIIFRNTALLPF